MAHLTARALRRMRDLAIAGRVIFTTKALLELSNLSVPLHIGEVHRLIANLTRDDFLHRRVSIRSGEILYAFLVQIEGCSLYLKLVLREDCVVISCHDDR